MTDTTTADHPPPKDSGRTTTGTATETTTETTTENTSPSLSKGAQRVLEAIKSNPTATLKELATMTGLSRDGVNWNVRNLKARNIIRRIGYTKGGHWELVEFFPS